MEYTDSGSLNNDFRTALQRLAVHGMNVCPRGVQTKELLNYNISLFDPRNRIINFKDRETNLKHLLCEFIKTLTSNKMSIFNAPHAHIQEGVGIPIGPNDGAMQFIIQDDKLHLISTTFRESAL